MAPIKLMREVLPAAHPIVGSRWPAWSEDADLRGHSLGCQGVVARHLHHHRAVRWMWCL